MNFRNFVAACCGLFAVYALPSPAFAALISFTTEFGTDGTGSFVYDDDSGGANDGFTEFTLDFSPTLGAAFSDITLTPFGVAFLGLGGGGATAVFSILTDPSNGSGAALFEDVFDPPFILALEGQAGNGLNVGGPLCFTPTAPPGGYAFCTEVSGRDVGGSGEFSTTLAAVPEPTSLALLAVGLIGLGWRRRLIAGRYTTPESKL